MTEITMTLEEAIQVTSALKSLSDTKLPIKQSYRIGKLIRKLEPEVKEFQTFQITVFEKHGGIRDEEANGWRFEDNEKGLQACQKELETILSEEITLEGVSKLVVDELSDEDIVIEPSILLLANPVITETE